MRKLSKTQEKILQFMRENGAITCEFTGDIESPVRYFLPGGSGVRISTFKALLGREAIIPDLSTSLFDDTPQSYVVAK